jgi:hypothetical protein
MKRMAGMGEYTVRKEDVSVILCMSKGKCRI